MEESKIRVDANFENSGVVEGREVVSWVEKGRRGMILRVLWETLWLRILLVMCGSKEACWTDDVAPRQHSVLFVRRFFCQIH
jgi:hypothetical protein